MGTSDVLTTSIQQTHDGLTERMEAARQMGVPAAEPRLGYERIDTFLASASMHLHAVDQVLDEMDDRIRSGIALICEALDIGFEVEQVGHFDPVTFDENCVRAVREAAERLGYTHRNIVSGAGHDACWVSRVAPTAMVMCPCVDGLSHNEAEEISKDWARAGADVLFHAVVETAEIVE